MWKSDKTWVPRPYTLLEPQEVEFIFFTLEFTNAYPYLLFSRKCDKCCKHYEYITSLYQLVLGVWIAVCPIDIALKGPGRITSAQFANH